MTNTLDLFPSKSNFLFCFLSFGKCRIVVSIMILCCTPFISHSQSTEADYCELINRHLNGEREYTVHAGRVDIVTDTHAYEVEWAHKWKESIGQALWYGLQTNKKPGIIIILREDRDYRYFQQLNSALLYAELEDKIEVRLYPHDFK